MKLTKLLELHHQNSQGLEKSFGDGFLLKHNRMYKNIREAALRFGFRFSHDGNSFYQALPFSQLEKILSSKSIPYLNNVTVLDELAKEHPALQWEDLSQGLKKNFSFHEACHAVARTLAKDLSPTDQELKTLQIMLEESFANVCELLAVVEAQDTAHRIFYESNSYTALFSDRTYLGNAMNEFGNAVLMKFLMLCYLQSNFLKAHLHETDFERIYKLASGRAAKELSPKQSKTLKALGRIAFNLDLDFRTTTTKLHLQLSGLTKSHEELMRFDFLKVLEVHATWASFVDSVIAIALGKNN